MDAMVRLLLLGLSLVVVSANVMFEKQCVTQEDLNQAVATIRAEYDQELREAKTAFKEEMESLTKTLNQELQDIKADLKEQKQINNRNNLQIAELQNDIARLKGERIQFAENENREAGHSAESNQEGKASVVQKKKAITDISGYRRYNQDKRTVLRRQTTTSKVAFSVALNAKFAGEYLANHQTIPFDDVRSNLGNAYHSNSNAFTAPVSGWYVFSLTMMSRPNEQQELEVVIEGAILFICYSTGDEYNSVSRTMVVHLDQGSDVWVRTSDKDLSPNVHAGRYTTFTGWLLYSD